MGSSLGQTWKLDQLHLSQELPGERVRAYQVEGWSPKAKPLDAGVVFSLSILKEIIV